MDEKKIEVFDWVRMLKTDDLPWEFLWEIAARTGIMFIALIIVLKFTGQRGIKQLSIFELALLIALGSAAGDPMFYEDVSLLFGFVVFMVVMLLYRFITFLSARFDPIEEFLEGKPLLIIENGKFNLENFKKYAYPHDKIFSELRIKNVEHLGQVWKLYAETSGEMSVFFVDDEDVTPGLPIFPELYFNPLEKIPAAGQYACTNCANVEHLSPGENTCHVCNDKKWLAVRDSKRIT
ncbi:MAG: YetF domain-containing protein [Bacteroidota bacterium]